jgi:hypothetical protein
MARKDDIRGANTINQLRAVFARIRQANTHSMNEELEPEELIRAIGLLALELERVSSDLAALRVALGR